MNTSPLTSKTELEPSAPLMPINVTLREQLHVLSIKIKRDDNTGDQLSSYLDELIHLTDQAYARQDFHFLGNCIGITQKLNADCFRIIPERQDLAQRFVRHFRLSAAIFTPFLTSDYLTLPEEVAEPLLDAMVDNIIRHESYFDPERPRVAEQLLEALLSQARTIAAPMTLFRAIVLSNTEHFCGAGFCIRALDETKEDHSDEADFLDSLSRNVNLQGTVADTADFLKAIENLRSSISKTNTISDGVIAWVKDHQELVAASIKAGPVTDWINDATVKKAQSLSLPVAGSRHGHQKY